ncbi:signal peptidase II [Candidatus Woesearchaeota archaeon]|nr:signal peptidase II [Candidatus Woesearchaeota archaeon]
MTSPRTYRRLNYLQNNLSLLLISTVIVIVDRIVKFYVTENLKLGESIPVLGSLLMITRTENPGAGFGLLPGMNWIFIGAAFLVLILIMYYYDDIIYRPMLVISAAFVVGGTVSNLMDRIFFAKVIDYINFSFWPNFNIADMSLVVGVTLLLIYMYSGHKKIEEPKYSHY